MRSSFGPKQKRSLLQVEEEDNDQFVDYPYRWIIVVLFIMPNMMNGMTWSTFSPISTQVEKAYDKSQFVITLASLSYMGLYVIVNFPSNYLLQRSLRFGVWVGSIFTILGAWVRIFINNNFWWAIFGQILGGIGQPFILNAPSKIAATWFKPHQRPMATAILALVNPIGSALGFIFPSLFVSDDENSDTKDQVYSMLFYQAIVVTVLIAPIFILFKEKPPTPPSHSAETDKMAFKDAFNSCMKNKDFLCLLGGFGCVLGNINSLSTIIDFYLSEFSYGSNDASYFGAIFIVSGLIGSACLSIIIEKTSAYKKVMVTSSIVSCIFGGMVMGLLPTNSIYAVLPACFFMGLTSLPLIPISMDFACEITFPVSEPFSSGFVLASGQFIGVILIIVSTYVIELNSQKQVFTSQGIGVGIQVLGALFYCFINENLKRKEEEIRIQNEASERLLQNKNKITQTSSECN